MGILLCYSAQFNCHACVDRQHIVCLHVTAVVSPRHTHKPSFLKGFTVHSGGSETTGHVRMQMIKTEESGSVIRYIKKHLRLKNHSRRLELGTSQPLTRKLPLWVELSRTRERETPQPNSNYSLYPQTGVFENQS